MAAVLQKICVTPIFEEGMFTSTKKPKYKYDTSWLELVIEGLCPERDGDLIKKGLLRKCNKCNFSIIGDPRLLAYCLFKEEIHSAEFYLNYLLEDHCPDCYGREFIYDSKHDETVCKCGSVLKGPPQYSGLKPIKYPFAASVNVDVEVMKKKGPVKGRYK